MSVVGVVACCAFLSVVRCCLSVVGCGLLFVVWCVLFVACCLLFGVLRLLLFSLFCFCVIDNR